MFKFFANPSYDLPNQYLVNTNQTAISNETLKLLMPSCNISHNLDGIKEVYNYVVAYFNDGEANKFSRGVEEIVSSRVLSGCNDYGLVMASCLEK